MFLTGSFSRKALKELEHVPAGLRDGCHLGDDRQVVNDEGDFVLLVLGQIHRVAEEAEPGHVGRSVGVVLVHHVCS